MGLAMQAKQKSNSELKIDYGQPGIQFKAANSHVGDKVGIMRVAVIGGLCDIKWIVNGHFKELLN